MFEADGSATMATSSTAYYGENEDDAELLFNINEQGIKIEASSIYIGMDCARYGDAQEEQYTLFKR